MRAYLSHPVAFHRATPLNLPINRDHSQDERIRHVNHLLVDTIRSRIASGIARRTCTQGRVGSPAAERHAIYNRYTYQPTNTFRKGGESGRRTKWQQHHQPQWVPGATSRLWEEGLPQDKLSDDHPPDPSSAAENPPTPARCLRCNPNPSKISNMQRTAPTTKSLCQ